MNLLREYIRNLLIEDAARRQALAKDLEGADNWPAKSAGDHRLDNFEPALARPSGRILKKAFHKHADHSFMNTLTTVHWADYPARIASMLKGSSKDEISTSVYLPGELKNTGTGAYGAYGLEIKGHISLLANNMDDINTGSGLDSIYADRHRSESSGINKGVKKTHVPSAYSDDKNPVLVLDKSDWNPQGAEDGIYNNEALVDNWHPVAIIVSNEEDYEDGDMEELEGLAKEYGIKIKRTKGMY